MSDLASVRRRIFRKVNSKSKKDVDNYLDSNNNPKEITDETLPDTTQNDITLSEDMNNSKEEIRSEIIFENVPDQTPSLSYYDIQESDNINIKRSGFIDTDEYMENMFIGDYVIIKELGSGSSAKVFLAYDKSTERRVAIKIVARNTMGVDKHKEKGSSKTTFSDSRVFRETIITSLIDHPHIIKLLDFMYSETHFFLVFEYVKGRSLYEQILKGPKISEERARKYFRQLLSAIDYLHKNCIIHRDLKIENIVIDDSDSLRLIDFGLSNFYDNSALMNTFCGSLYFAAPELLIGVEYSGPEVDIWSMGIILYVMIYGKVPFDDDDVKTLQTKIKEAKVLFDEYITAEAKDLILQMIVSDPSERHTIKQIKDSKWVNIGYQSKVDNFMMRRDPLIELNPEYTSAIIATTSFQFSNAQGFLNDFVDSCRKQEGKGDNIYWLKNPVVSLYYLLQENIEKYCDQTGQIFIDDNDLVTEENNYRYLQNLHNFVRFVFGNDSRNIPCKFFPIDTCTNQKEEKPRRSCKYKKLNPTIKKSYLKGIFQGVKVKSIGSQNALKKIILDILKENSVVFEIDENAYFCTYKHKDSECYFKITLYYNVILNDFYLVLKCLNSAKDSFKIISEAIQDALSTRS